MQGESGTDGGAHRDRHDDRLLDAGEVEQASQIVRLIPQRVAVERHLALAVAAPVVGEAAVSARKMRDLCLEQARAVGFPVNEYERRPASGRLVVEPAAV